MVRHRMLLITSLGPVLAAMLVVLAHDRPFDRSPVYSVADLRSHLAEHPRIWLGRTLLVRGEPIAMACAAPAGTPILCAPPRVALTDLGPSQAVAPLPLTPAGTDPWLAMARRLPVVGSALPPPQVVHWGRMAVYRVQLRTLADTTAGSAAYEALLLDAAPSWL